MSEPEERPPESTPAEPTPTDDYPLVSPYGPVRAPVVEPPTPHRPQPGWWLSCVAGFVFLLVTIAGLAAGTIIDFIVRIVTHPDPDAFMKGIEKHLEVPGNTTLPPEIMQSLGTGMLVGELVSVVFALLFLRLVLGRGWHRKIALRLPKWHHLLIAVLMLPALMIAHGIAHEVARLVMDKVWPGDKPPPDEMFREMFAGWPAWLAVLTIGFGPGLGEELVCRGYIGRGLLARYGYVVGIGMTSVIFGAMHGSVTYAMGTAVMGAFLHGILLATRSLWVTIMLHTLNNSISVLASLKLMNLDKLETPPEAGTPWLLYAASILVTAAGFWLLWRSRVRVIDSRTGEEWEPPWATAAMPSDRRFVAESRFPGFAPIAAFGISLYTLIHVLVF